MIQPFLARIYTEVIADQHLSAGGLHLPDAEGVNAPRLVRVLSVGDKCEYLKVGDVVLCGRYAGIEVDMEGDGRLLLQEAEVLARIDVSQLWTIEIAYTDDTDTNLVNLGPLLNARIVDEKERAVISGVLLDAAFHESNTAAEVKASGICTVTARRGDEFFRVSCGTATLLRGSRLVADRDA